MERLAALGEESPRLRHVRFRQSVLPQPHAVIDHPRGEPPHHLRPERAVAVEEVLVEPDTRGVPQVLRSLLAAPRGTIRGRASTPFAATLPCATNLDRRTARETRARVRRDYEGPREQSRLCLMDRRSVPRGDRAVPACTRKPPGTKATARESGGLREDHDQSRTRIHSALRCQEGTRKYPRATRHPQVDRKNQRVPADASLRNRPRGSRRPTSSVPQTSSDGHSIRGGTVRVGVNDVSPGGAPRDQGRRQS